MVAIIGPAKIVEASMTLNPDSASSEPVSTFAKLLSHFGAASLPQ
jgi:hypothetical protein